MIEIALSLWVALQLLVVVTGMMVYFDGGDGYVFEYIKNGTISPLGAMVYSLVIFVSYTVAAVVLMIYGMGRDVIYEVKRYD